ncbi:MAG: response regulator, partial [Myxococcaceae bacterium]
LLEQEGYSVASAAGAEEARVLLEGLRPAMVLLDLRLSEEDGRSVLRHLRGQPEMADTPVYIISGASELASLSTGTGLDRIDGFFEKPLHLPKLLDTVASVVRPVRSAR